MKNIFLFVFLTLFLNFIVYAEELIQLNSQEIVDISNDIAQKYGANAKDNTEYYSNDFKAYDCPKSLFNVQKFIQKLDSIIYEYPDKSKIREIVYRVLKDNNNRGYVIFGNKSRDYLQSYYDSDLTNDFFTGCFGDPDIYSFRPDLYGGSYFWPGIRGGHINLTGYLIVENIGMQNMDCLGMDDDCLNYQVPVVYFVLTSNPKNLLFGVEIWDDNPENKKAGDKISLGCLLNDNSLLVTHSYMGAEGLKPFIIKNNQIEQLLNNDENNPISIAGSYQISITRYGGDGYYGILCPGEFRTIDILE